METELKASIRHTLERVQSEALGASKMLVDNLATSEIRLANKHRHDRGNNV